MSWLAYVWGVGRSGNPLMDGFGIPSAAMLEIVIGANGFDLTPGLESRSSCPEAISQAAKYWHEYYEDQKKDPLSGFYYTSHHLLTLLRNCSYCRTILAVRQKPPPGHQVELRIRVLNLDKTRTIRPAIVLFLCSLALIAHFSLNRL